MGDAMHSHLEGKRGLQFDLTISGSTRRKRTTQLKRIGFAKQAGSHNPVRIREVVIVEGVASNHAESEVVTAVSVGRHHGGTSAEYRTAVSSAATGSTTTVAPLALGARGGSRFRSESKSLSKAQVHHKVCRSVAIVHRQKLSAAEHIEGTQGRAVNVVLRPGGRRMGGTRGS